MVAEAATERINTIVCYGVKGGQTLRCLGGNLEMNVNVERACLAIRVPQPWNDAEPPALTINYLF